MTRTLLIATVTLGLAACGSASQPTHVSQASQTHAAAICLRTALANGSNGSSSCSTAYSHAAALTVDCWHHSTVVYACDVNTDSTTIASGFYTVTYDGSSITYQQTQ